MWKAAQEYNEQIKQESVPDAFSVRDGQTDSTYESLLNLNGDGMMGYVEIPVIDVSIPIYHYTTDESLEKGAGHLFGSSLPVGGKSTHCILSAHRVPMKAAKAVQKAEKKVTGITNPTLPMLALCVVIGIVIAVILVAGINSVQNKKRRRK